MKKEDGELRIQKLEIELGLIKDDKSKKTKRLRLFS